MSDYGEHLAQHRRITLLRLLEGGGGSANESILQDALEQCGLGAMLTRAVTRELLKWLEDRNLIRIEWFGQTLAVAHITERGVNVAKGKETVEGVKRPSVGG